MDVNVLKSVLALKGKKIKELALAIGISKSAFYRKLKGESDFTYGEILRIRDDLNINNEKMLEIFFNQKVS